MAAMTQRRLRELITYNPDTGSLAWAVVRPGTRVGARAGHVCATSGYWMGMLDGRMYRQHRLAWLYMMGLWPEREIGHINCDRADNRWSNLRDVDHALNQQNRAGPNKGRKRQLARCVEFFSDKRVKPFRAVVTIDGKRHRSEYFATASEAEQAAGRLRISHRRAEADQWA